MIGMESELVGALREDLDKQMELLDYKDNIISSLTDELAGAEAQLRSFKALADRWNNAASRAGFVGSEYVDDPEFTFGRVQEMKHRMHQANMALAKARRTP